MNVGRREIMTCRDWNHKFNLKVKGCKYKHCSKCGECQCKNGGCHITLSEKSIHKGEVKRTR